MLIGGVWPVFSLFRDFGGARRNPDHRQLAAFALEVSRRTPPRSTIRFVLPDEVLGSGLADHRVRYLVVGRQVVLSGPADYVAAWHEEQSASPVAGKVVWRGCGGVLVRE